MLRSDTWIRYLDSNPVWDFVLGKVWGKSDF